MKDLIKFSLTCDNMWRYSFSSHVGISEGQFGCYLLTYLYLDKFVRVIMFESYLQPILEDQSSKFIGEKQIITDIKDIEDRRRWKVEIPTCLTVAIELRVF